MELLLFVNEYVNFVLKGLTFINNLNCESEFKNYIPRLPFSTGNTSSQ